MQFNGKTVCVCDCEGSMPLAAGQIAKACDGAATDVATHLCRAQLGRFEETLKAIDGDVVVACTQEAPLFLETAEDLGFEGELTFTNIREKAGWSSEGDKATPKALALLAEATLPRPITGTVELESGVSVLVIGGDDKAWEAAETLAATLTVTLLLKPDEEFTPPTVSQFPVFSGTARSAAGHLGAFSVTLADVAAYTPSSRQSLEFEPASDGGEFEFDLILDLSGGAPLVTSPEKRDGYFNPEPGNPAAVMTALFELAGLTGTFEKPQYVAYDPDICAHARSGIVGCTKCIDACPAGAISSAGEKVDYDANIWFWVAMLGGAALSVTGILLDFPSLAQDPDWLRIAQIIHASAAVIVIAPALGHIYVGTVGIEGSLESMTTGYVDENWAIEHHDLWAEQVMNEQSGEAGEEKAAEAQPAE